MTSLALHSISMFTKLATSRNSRTERITTNVPLDVPLDVPMYGNFGARVRPHHGLIRVANLASLKRPFMAELPRILQCHIQFYDRVRPS